ncbi:MAG TPA: hypothetical protein VFA03_01655 [Acetobacteraceae bacterium]|nr:hypothetical protein [Acetobacteraceae bacterium]
MSTLEELHEKAIQERALRMWREDGAKPGGLSEYLERARELQAIVDNPQAGQLPNPLVAHHGEVEPGPLEEAEIQENLGEFPGLLGDQGDHLPTPMTRSKLRRWLHED